MSGEQQETRDSQVWVLEYGPGPHKRIEKLFETLDLAEEYVENEVEYAGGSVEIDLSDDDVEWFDHGGFRVKVNRDLTLRTFPMDVISG